MIPRPNGTRLPGDPAEPSAPATPSTAAAQEPINPGSIREAQAAAPLDTTDGWYSNPTRINVGGAALELPPGATEEQKAGAIAHYRTTPEFERSIDRDRGAPAMVRALVGSASKQEDKLTSPVRLVRGCPYP